MATTTVLIEDLEASWADLRACRGAAKPTRSIAKIVDRGHSPGAPEVTLLRALRTLPRGKAAPSTESELPSFFVRGAPPILTLPDDAELCLSNASFAFGTPLAELLLHTQCEELDLFGIYLKTSRWPPIDEPQIATLATPMVEVISQSTRLRGQRAAHWNPVFFSIALGDDPSEWFCVLSDRDVGGVIAVHPPLFRERLPSDCRVEYWLPG